ncbi:IS630 family transposase [Streptomyces ruber]|uniref:IS630 family transposase n=2 Tax=Streptomyces TaxID=1883 RepID=A0A918BLN6_9ACTN|nr:IS630 family transposase [Streptomyces ruber]GGQ72826.1 IS630 family transposase [Streptomyces ruber]
MAEPVRVRRLTDQEGQKLQQIVRRGSTSSVRYRRAMMLLASAGGNRVPVIAQLVQADEDTVREVIHRFNEIGLACLDPQRAGGRPRLLTPDDEDFVIQTATTRPTKLGQPSTRWSIRKLAAYLRRVHGRIMHRPRSLTLPAPPPRHHLPAHQDLEGVPRPGARRQTRPDRARPGALPEPGLCLRRVRTAGIRPTAGSCWAKQGRPDRLPATYRRTHGVTYFHGCYSVGDDRLWGVNRRRKGTANTLAALKSIRAARPDGAPIYIILDNLSAHTGADIRRWAKKNKIESCFTPTYASWANPIEAHFGPLRQFTRANSNHRSHPAQTQALHAYLRWRNANARHPDILAAQRRERARIRSEKSIRWGGRPLTGTA